MRACVPSRRVARFEFLSRISVTVYRIGIVGCGRISHQHFKAAQALSSRLTIAAACDVDQTLLNQACDTFNVPANQL